MLSDMIRPVLRRAVILFVFLAFAAGGVTIALAGLGSTPITKAQAETFAQAVNLRASDLPGATVLQGFFSPDAVQYKALKCGRQRKGGRYPVGGGESWLSDSQGNAAEIIGSIIVVAPNQNVAEAKLATLGSRHGRACLARALGRALTFERHHRLEWSHTVKATFLPVVKLGGDRTIAIHVLAKLPLIEGESPSPKRRAKYINVEAAFFRAGPAEVAFLALGATRFPPATEAHLLTLLHSRAEAHTIPSPSTP